MQDRKSHPFWVDAMPRYIAWQSKCTWISALSGPLSQALLCRAHSAHPCMAALLKEVETGTCGRTIVVAYEDVHLCSRKLWEPSLLAQNIIKTSKITFAAGIANYDKELAKRISGNLERLLWKEKLTDGIYSFALVLPSEWMPDVFFWFPMYCVRLLCPKINKKIEIHS